MIRAARPAWAVANAWTAALWGSPKCVMTAPAGRIETAFVPPSRARAIAMPRSGVAATSARTSSAVTRGRSAETTAAIGSVTTSRIAAASASFQASPPSSKRGTPFGDSASADTIVIGPTSASFTAARTPSSSSSISAARSSAPSTPARRLFASSRRLSGTRTWAEAATAAR